VSAFSFAIGSESQLDRLQEERVEALVLDAVRSTWEIDAIIAPRVERPVRWRLPEILKRLHAAGKVERRKWWRPGTWQWRRTGGGQ
jgi:hypothetical protein